MGEMMFQEVELVVLHTTAERDVSLCYHDTYKFWPRGKFFHRVSREKCECPDGKREC